MLSPARAEGATRRSDPHKMPAASRRRPASLHGLLNRGRVLNLTWLSEMSLVLPAFLAALLPAHIIDLLLRDPPAARMAAARSRNLERHHQPFVGGVAIHEI